MPEKLFKEIYSWELNNNMASLQHSKSNKEKNKHIDKLYVVNNGWLVEDIYNNAPINF